MSAPGFHTWSSRIVGHAEVRSDMRGLCLRGVRGSPVLAAIGRLPAWGPYHFRGCSGAVCFRMGGLIGARSFSVLRMSVVGCIRGCTVALVGTLLRRTVFVLVRGRRLECSTGGRCGTFTLLVRAGRGKNYQADNLRCDPEEVFVL